MTVKIDHVYFEASIEDLVPYDKNSRKHSIEQIKKIEKSMKEFGFTNPILIDEQMVIIAGHGRLEAAKNLLMQHVPVIMIKGLTDDQKRALIIADNKLALDASWDNDLLIEELNSIVESGFNIEVTGFTNDELDSLTTKYLDDRKDDVIEPEENKLIKCPNCSYEFSEGEKEIKPVNC